MKADIRDEGAPRCKTPPLDDLMRFRDSCPRGHPRAGVFVIFLPSRPGVPMRIQTRRLFNMHRAQGDVFPIVYRLFSSHALPDCPDSIHFPDRTDHIAPSRRGDGSPWVHRLAGLLHPRRAGTSSCPQFPFFSFRIQAREQHAAGIRNRNNGRRIHWVSALNHALPHTLWAASPRHSPSCRTRQAPVRRKVSGKPTSSTWARRRRITPSTCNRDRRSARFGEVRGGPFGLFVTNADCTDNRFFGAGAQIGG